MNGGEQENPEIQPPSSYGTPPPPAEPAARIQWGVFFRLASPLAILAGVVTYLFPPIGLFLLLPITLKRIIARYRPLHSGALRSGQGALMGAFMAALSFVAFLVFVLPTLSLSRTPMLDKIREKAAQAPDPQSQQMMLWFTTTQGFIVFTALLIGFVLAIFLITGAVSGAVITRTKKVPLAP